MNRCALRAAAILALSFLLSAAAVDGSRAFEATLDRTREPDLTFSKVHRNGPWKLSLDGVAPSKDRELPIAPPEQERVDIIPYAVGGGNERGNVRTDAVVGHLVIEQTPYTVSGLARRGAALKGSAGSFSFDAFSVRGDDDRGTGGGLSLDGGTDRHIRGGSGTARILSDKVTLKVVYVDGGETSRSSQTVAAEGARRGDALGFRMTSDFFAGKMMTDFEVDFAELTLETSVADAPPRKDRAVRAGVQGAAGIFTYDALFEYVGRDYEVIGNQALARNREGAKLGGSAKLGSQFLRAGVSRYNDNVRGDPLRPVNVFWNAHLQYAVNRWAGLPVSVFYRHGRQECDDVPGTGFNTFERVSHNVGGQISWLAEGVAADLSGGYSRTENRTAANADTSAWNVRLAPRLTGSFGSLTPSAAYAQKESGQVPTEVTTFGLDARSQFLRSRMTAELRTTWAGTRTSDRSQDDTTVNGSFRLAYHPAPFLPGHFVPSVAFRGAYDRGDTAVPDSDRERWTLQVTLTAELPVVL